MKTLKYIALAALTLSFAACEKENDFQGVSDSDAVKINATIGALQTRVAYSGKNGITSFEAGDKIGVKNTMRTSKNEATYTTTDGMNWITSDVMVWNGSSKNKFQAWYPVEDNSSFESFTIPEDQATIKKLALADWMTLETDVIDKPEDGELDLNFQHRLAKVTVNLTFGLEYPEESRTVSNFKFYTNEATPVAITPFADGTSYTAILWPDTYAYGTNFITLTMNGTDNLTVAAKSKVTGDDGNPVLKSITLEAGNYYTFNLKVGKDAVEIGSVTVSEWIEQNINGGVAEEVVSQQGETPTE